MSPIVTHEDELTLAKDEKELSAQIKKLANAQSDVISSQKKYAENLAKTNLARKSLNRNFRDVLKQMQTLVREHRSNVKDEDVNLIQDLIHKNDKYIEDNDKYINAIKDLAVKKEYFVEKKNEFADALIDVADKRAKVIKKALSVENVKNKMIDGDKLNLLDQQLNDIQREFDRARDVLLKRIDQFLQVRDELKELYLNLKDSTTELS